jgi:hypothetical protein
VRSLIVGVVAVIYQYSNKAVYLMPNVAKVTAAEIAPCIEACILAMSSGTKSRQKTDQLVLYSISLDLLLSLLSNSYFSCPTQMGNCCNCEWIP